MRPSFPTLPIAIALLPLICIPIPVSADCPDLEGLFRWQDGISDWSYIPGAWDPQGPYDIALLETVLLVPSYYYGLRTYEIVGPGEVEERGFFWLEYLDEVEAGDGHAFLGSQGEIAIVDVTEPDSPTLEATIDAPYHQLHWSDGRLYVTHGTGLHIYDVTVPASPVLLGFLSNPTYKVAVSGERAYVTRPDVGGLWIADVSDPSEPEWLGQVQSGSPEDVEVHGALLYVSSGGGVSVYDLSDPDTPALLTDIPVGGAISVGEGRLLAEGSAGSSEGITYVDVSSPGAPVVGSRFDLEMAEAVIADGYAYVGAFNDGLQILELGEGEGVFPVASFSEYGDAAAVAPIGGEYIVVGFPDQVEILGLGDPDAPNVVGTFPLSNAQAIAIDGDIAWFVAPDGLYSLDVSDPTAPTQVGFLDVSNVGSKIAIASGRLYSARDYGSLLIYDITDPANPALLESVGDMTVSGMVAEGPYLYLSSSFEGTASIFKWDLSDLSDWEWVGGLSLSLASVLELHGDDLMIGGYTETVVVDKETMFRRGGLGDHPFTGVDVVVTDDELVIGRSNGAFHFLDLDAEAGELAYRYSGTVPYGQENEMAVLQERIYFFHGDGLDIFRLPCDPATVEGGWTDGDPGLADLSPGPVLRSFPNPTNGPATLQLDGSRSDLGSGKIDLYSVDGRWLRTLELPSFGTPTSEQGRGSLRGGPEALSFTVEWDGSDSRGRPVPAGIVLARYRGVRSQSSETIRIVR